MTSKRNPDQRSEHDHASDPESPSTLRSIEAAEAAALDSESSAQPLYYEPQLLIAATDHKTIELETVRLAEDIDPRKLPTELRLARPNIAQPDSGWPQAEVVVVSSQPPLAGRRRWRAPLVLLVLLGALVLLVLARGAARRRAHAQAVTAASPTETSAPTPASETAPVASETAPVVADPVPPAAAPAPRSEKHASTPRNTKISPHSSDSAPSATSRALAAPSASKPKRAIY